MIGDLIKEYGFPSALIIAGGVYYAKSEIDHRKERTEMSQRHESERKRWLAIIEKVLNKK